MSARQRRSGSKPPHRQVRLRKRYVAHLMRQLERKQARTIEPIPFTVNSKPYRLALSCVIAAARNGTVIHTWSRGFTTIIRKMAEKA